MEVAGICLLGLLRSSNPLPLCLRTLSLSSPAAPVLLLRDGDNLQCV